MTLGTLDYIRVWAALTGVVLAAGFFVTFYATGQISPTLAMLVSAIGGFEMVLYGQDMAMRRKRNATRPSLPNSRTPRPSSTICERG